MPRIDIHTHFQCLDFVKHLLGRSAFPRSVVDGGTYAVECAAGFRVPALPKIIDMDAKLRDLEAMDIAVSVLSHGLPLGPDVLGGAEADDWAMRINDDLARIVAAYPGKFVGFGTLARCSMQRNTVRCYSISVGWESRFTCTLPCLSSKPAWTVPALRCRSGFRTTPA
jgi:predicted TIM-barrel fold metal-dependent hydrolase